MRLSVPARIRRSIAGICNLLIVLNLALIAGCSSPQEKAERSASTAMALADARNFEAARTAILEAIKQRDDVPDQWLLLGRLDLETSRPADALLAYSRVLELDATNVEALQLVAELSFQFGNNSEALRSADRMLALDPNSTRALLVKGLVALDRKHVPEAMNAADAILKINPQDEFGVVLKARALAVGKDYQGAVKLIEDSVPEGRRTEPSLATLTELYRVLGDRDRLIATMDKQLARRPKDSDLKLDLAQILYKAGNKTRARSILNELLAAQPDSIEIVQKISAMWLENDPEALSASQIAAIARSGSKTTRLGVARYLLARNRADLAGEVLRTAAIGNSGAAVADVQALYAAALYRQGNVEAAKALADQIIDSDKDNTDALLVRARIELQQRNLAAALNDAQIVVRDFPLNEQGRIVLAEIFLAKNEIQRVKQSYEDAISDMPQSIVMSRAYTDYLLKSGDKARAVDVARTFTRKSPSSVQGWDLLGIVCSRVGDIGCLGEAQAGRDKAAAAYTVDVRPGSIRSRGLFGKL